MALLAMPIVAWGDSVEIVAEAFCQCNRSEHSATDAAMEAFGNGDIALMMEKNEEREILGKQSEACRIGLREKYAGKSKDFADAVNVELDRRCPAPRWTGGMPTMGGVGGSVPGEQQHNGFMRSQIAPPK